MTIIFSRVRANPNAATFTIKPIAALLSRYIGNGRGWIDPYAGDNSPAEFRNDQNLDRSAEYHYDALEFCRDIAPAIKPAGGFTGVLFDPPYSYRQVTEHYSIIGKKATPLDTSNNFYNRVMNPICDQIIPGGYAVSFGWNSNGFGKNRGFEIIEILLVAHGQHHYDTICTVERKMQSNLLTRTGMIRGDITALTGGDER